jgi:F0F1-type ATP synthase epsilon subunit
MAFPFQAEAQYEFEGANEGEMTVYAGEVVTVTAEADGGWYVCTNGSGQTGYVPAGFLEAKTSKATVASEAETKDSKEESKTEEKSALKKRASTKKLDGSPKVKSSKEKKKTEDKKKEEKPDKKRKKDKKAKTTEATAPELSSEMESRESAPNGSTSSPPTSAHLEQSPAAQSDSRGSLSPRAGASSPRARALPEINPSSDSISSLSASSHSGSVSTPILRSLPSVPSSTGSPPSSADRKLPPAVPQKRIAIAQADSARIANRNGTYTLMLFSQVPLLSIYVTSSRFRPLLTLGDSPSWLPPTVNNLSILFSTTSSLAISIS